MHKRGQITTATGDESRSGYCSDRKRGVVSVLNNSANGEKNFLAWRSGELAMRSGKTARQFANIRTQGTGGSTVKAARKSYLSRSDVMSEVQHEAVTTPIRKTMPPADHPTNRDLRKRRDKFWLLLSKHGMTSVEISRVCAFANRSPEQIRKRLCELRRHLSKQDDG